MGQGTACGVTTFIQMAHSSPGPDVPLMIGNLQIAQVSALVQPKMASRLYLLPIL